VFWWNHIKICYNLKPHNCDGDLKLRVERKREPKRLRDRCITNDPMNYDKCLISDLIKNASLSILFNFRKKICFNYFSLLHFNRLTANVRRAKRILIRLTGITFIHSFLSLFILSYLILYIIILIIIKYQNIRISSKQIGKMKAEKGISYEKILILMISTYLWLSC
jgi:hypothetical protein